MSFWSWLTGRSDKESDVYANYDKVEIVVNDIQGVANKTVDAQTEIITAIQRLNNVNGLAEYVGTVDVNGYDSVFKSVQDSIVSIGEQLQGKAENIKAYEEAPWYKKALSTFTMTVTKAAEGLLSVVEDLGDGVVSLAGWAAGGLGAKQFQSDCANFVKKEWSHDAFNFYYQSDFAKASAITEDSAAAGAFKLAGKCVGYLYAGGAVAGAMGAAGVGGATGMVGSGIFSASTTTLGATAAGFLGGVGSGTETGLNLGLEYNDAMKVGFKEGAIQGGLAFVGGKLSEVSKANAVLKEANGGKGNILEAAKKVGTGGNYNVQGYSDAITKAGQRFGEATVNTTKAGITALKKTASASVAIRKGAADAGIKTQAAETAKATFKENLNTLGKENPVIQGFSATKTGVKTLSSGVKSATTTLKDKGLSGTIKDGLTTAKSAVTTGAKNLKSTGLLKTASNGIAKVTTTAGKIITNPTVLSVGATTVGTAMNENMSQQSREVLEETENSRAIQESIDDGTKPYTLTTETPTPKSGEEMFTSEEITDSDHDYQTTSEPGQNTGESQNGESQQGGQNGSSGVQTENETGTGTTTGNNASTPEYSSTNDGGGSGNNNGNGNENENKNEQTTQYPAAEMPKPTGGGGNKVEAPEYSTTNSGGSGNGNNNGTSTNGGINQQNEYTPHTGGGSGGHNVDAPEYPHTNNNNNSENRNNSGTSTGGRYTDIIPTDPHTGGGNPVKAPEYSYNSATTSGGGESHSGGGYSGTSGYTGRTADGAITGKSTGGLAALGLESAEKSDSLDEIVEKSASSLDGIIKGSKLMKIPGSKKPISQSISSSKSAVIPIAAGLSAAAAAGIGAKAYIDHKKSEEFEDEYEEDDEFDTSDWTEDADIEEYESEEFVPTEPEAEGFADNLAADTDKPYYDDNSMVYQEEDSVLDDFTYMNDLQEA